MRINPRKITERSSLAVTYVAINYGAFIIGIITYLLYIKVLSPLEIGLIAISRTWGQLFDYFHFGLRFSIDRYSPVRPGKFSKSLLLLALVLTLITGAAVIATMYFAKQEGIVFYSIIISSFLIALSNCFKAHFRAHGREKDLLINGLLLQVAPTAINLLAFWFIPKIETLKFYCVPYLIFSFALLFYYGRKLLIVDPILNMIAAYKCVYKHAGSQFLYAVIALLNITVDRFYVEYQLGRESLGIYSVQLFVLSALSFLPATLSELKIREIMKNYQTKPSLPNSRMIWFVAGPTMIALILAILLLTVASDFFQIIKSNPLGFYVSAVCVIPVIFTSLYSQTISASKKSHLLVIIGSSIFILNITLLVGYNIINDDFTIAGPMIKLMVGAIESIALFQIAKYTINAE